VFHYYQGCCICTSTGHTHAKLTVEVKRIIKKILITTKESINKMNDHILRETCLAACTIKYLLLLMIRNDNHITYKNLLRYFLDDTSYMLLLIYLLTKNRLECIHLEPKTQNIIFEILNVSPFSFERLDFNTRSFQ
jgi:hypothetical protein